MSGPLPKGWVDIQLQNLIVFALGGDWGKKTEEISEGWENVTILRGTEFKNWHIEKGKTAVQRIVKIDSLTKRQLFLNDFVIEISGGGPNQPVGRVIYIDETTLLNSTMPLICSNFCRKIRLTNLIVPKYAFFNLNHQYARGIFDQYQNNSTNIRNLQFEEFCNGVTVPLPPLNEQKRIVAKLDKIIPRIDSVQARLDRVPTIIKRFRQSVLIAAVTGKLTEKWREEHISETIECRLEEIITHKPRNGYSPKSVKYETPVKSLTLTATTSGTFNANCFKYIDEVIPDDSHLWLEKNDILIQRSNSINYVGISAIYEGNNAEFIYPDLMMKVKAKKDKVLPKYLLLSLQSHKTLDYFRTNATGTSGSMPKINQPTVMNAIIPLPPLEEQQEIVRQVDKLFALADKLEAHYQKAKTHVGKLSQSVLAKAFRGELVPQDPNDEPAEKLLARIMKEKNEKSQRPAAKRTTP